MPAWWLYIRLLKPASIRVDSKSARAVEYDFVRVCDSGSGNLHFL